MHDKPVLVTTKGAMAEQVRVKELGYVSHFLDAVWDNLGRSTVLAVGVAGASGYMAGGFSPQLLPVALLASLLPALAGGVARTIDAAERARIHDTPRVQQFIRDVEAKAEGAVASQRGSVWIVRRPGTPGAYVLNDREYARFRRRVVEEGLALDEVTLRRGEASVARTAGGRLDPAGRDLPAMVSMDAGTGRISWTKWLLKGMPANREEVAKASTAPAYRASRFLSGGSGHDDAPPRREAPAHVRRPAYSASRFLSGGSGHDDADAPASPAFGR
jgi:hypothetical protein